MMLRLMEADQRVRCLLLEGPKSVQEIMTMKEGRYLISSKPSKFFLINLHSPVRRRCNYCNVEVVTYVEHEGHPLFLLIAIMVMLIFGFLSLIILPIGYLATKNAVHRCSRCLQKMGEKRCFGIPTNF